MELSIERTKPEDAQEIQNILYETWVVTYPNEEHGITLDDIKTRHQRMRGDEAVAKNRKWIREMKENEMSLVAKNDGKVIGICYLEKKEDRNQLGAMYVLSEFQRMGVGQKLWQEAVKFFDPLKDIYVEVVEYNEKAINFYKKLGFIDTGRRFTDERFRMKSGSIMPEMEMVRKAV